jgi:hypothetical protein
LIAIFSTIKSGVQFSFKFRIFRCFCFWSYLLFVLIISCFTLLNIRFIFSTSFVNYHTQNISMCKTIWFFLTVFKACRPVLHGSVSHLTNSKKIFASILPSVSAFSFSFISKPSGLFNGVFKFRVIIFRLHTCVTG